MNQKIGAQPGSLLYIGETKLNEDVIVTMYNYNEETYEKETLTSNNQINFRINNTLNNWINLDGIHNIELMKKLGDEFGIDLLILEDIINNNQRPKVEIRDNFIFITLKKLSLVDDILAESNDFEYKYEQISLLLFKDKLITLQESSLDFFDTIRNRIENKIGRLRKKNIDYLAYALIDRVVDNYFLIIEDLENRADELEATLIVEPAKDSFDKIFSLKKDIIKFRKIITPLKEVSLKLKEVELKEYFGDDVEIYLKDLQDHIIVVNESTEALLIKSNDLLQLYHSTISTGMNEIMKVLTMISSVFIPLSFLAGLYGMNFETIPELKWEYGYFGLLAVMFSIGLSAVVFFKRKRWW